MNLVKNVSYGLVFLVSSNDFYGRGVGVVAFRKRHNERGRYISPRVSQGQSLSRPGHGSNSALRLSVSWPAQIFFTDIFFFFFADPIFFSCYEI